VGFLEKNIIYKVVFIVSLSDRGKEKYRIQKKQRKNKLWKLEFEKKDKEPSVRFVGNNQTFKISSQFSQYYSPINHPSPHRFGLGASGCGTDARLL